MSSERWEAEQRAKHAAGEARSFRALELFRGEQIGRFKGRLEEIVTAAPRALPVLGQTVAARCLLFRMVSRNGSAVEMLLREVTQACPYRQECVCPYCLNFGVSIGTTGLSEAFCLRLSGSYGPYIGARSN